MKKLIIVATIVGSLLLYVMSVYNSLVTQEEGIRAANEDMKNVHASIFNSIKSQGLAVDKYGDMVINAISASMTGRYGANGSSAAMQWIQEQSQNVDPKIIEKLQVVIEAGYNKFEAKQTTKIDRVGIYRKDLRIGYKLPVVWLLGFPKINLDDIGATIVTAETKTTFETKEMKTIDPFAK